MVAKGDRPFDILVYGATGYTGKKVVEYLVEKYPSLPVAISGRTENKLRKVAEELNLADSSVLIASLDNDGSGTSMNKDQRYDLAEQLLPYLEFYVSRLDLVGPHLPLLRPHVSKLLKRNRIAKITPHVDRLFARGYMSLGTSANLDILLFWLGWTLSVPLLPRIFFAIPGSPKFVSFLANRLPRRFARKCSSVTCSLDGDYGSSWNRLSKD